MWRRIRKLNDSIAAALTLAIGTMWCVYLFVAVAVVPYFAPSWSTAIQYISSAFLQLVFLPLIMVGQSVLGRETEKRARQDHEVLLAQFEEMKAMHRDLLDARCPLL
jgi:membrane protein implicated in regulation of membrane protease activity